MKHLCSNYADVVVIKQLKHNSKQIKLKSFFTLIELLVLCTMQIM